MNAPGPPDDGGHSSELGTNRSTIGKVLRSSAAAQFVSLLASLLVLPRILHRLTVSTYGEWATLGALLAIGQLAQAGSTTELLRRVADAHGRADADAVRLAVREGISVLLLIAIALELTTFVTAKLLVSSIFVQATAGTQGQLVLILIGLVSLFNIGLVVGGYLSILSGAQRSDYALWSSVGAIITSAGVTLLCLSAGMGLWALLVADVSQLIVGWIGPLIGIWRHIGWLPVVPARPSLSLFLGFLGLPVMVIAAQASDLFDTQVDKLVLTHAAGAKASAMFQIGSGVVQAARGLALTPLAIMLVGTSELLQRDPLRLKRLEDVVAGLVPSIGAVAMGGLILFGRTFVTLWLGRGYSQAGVSIQILAIAALLNVWAAPWTYYAIGRGKYYYVIVCAGVTLIVNASATIFLTARIGLDGALIGSLAGSASGVLTARFVVRHWRRDAWLKPGLRSIVSIACLVALIIVTNIHIPANWWEFSSLGVAYVLIAATLIILLGRLPFKVIVRLGRLPRIVVE